MRLFAWVFVGLLFISYSIVWGQTFTIKGRITHLANQSIQLLQLDQKKILLQVKTNQQGDFTLSGQTTEISRAVVTWGPAKGIPFVLSPQRIQIASDSGLTNLSVKYDSIDYSKIYQQYQSIENSYLENFKALEEYKVNATYRNQQDSIAYYSSQINDLANTTLSKLHTFIMSGQLKGMESLVAWQASGLIGWRDQFSFFTDLVKFPVIKGLYKQKIVDYLSHSQLAGQQIPTVTLIDQYGKQYDLNALNKKYVLIDFWASWCGPCIAQLPTLDELVKKYSEKVVVVSLSIDENKERWRRSLQQHPTDWLQCLDQEQVQSLKTYFKVGGIPDYILVAPGGKILGSHLDLSAISDQLAKP